MMGFIMKNLLLILAYYSKRFHYNSSISSCNSKYLTELTNIHPAGVGASFIPTVPPSLTYVIHVENG